MAVAGVMVGATGSGLIVTIFDEVTAGQPAPPLTVKVRVMPPAALSAALGV